MRTTVNLDEDVYQAVTSLSKSSGASLGKVLSEVARRGLKSESIKKRKKRLPTFEVPTGVSTIPGVLAYKIQAKESII